MPEAKTVTEWCAYCGRENTIEWDVDTEGFVAYCPGCGKKMLLCDACQHHPDNPNMDCNTERCKYRRKQSKAMKAARKEEHADS